MSLIGDDCCWYWESWLLIRVLLAIELLFVRINMDRDVAIKQILQNPFSNDH